MRRCEPRKHAGSALGALHGLCLMFLTAVDRQRCLSAWTAFHAASKSISWSFWFIAGSRCTSSVLFKVPPSCFLTTSTSLDQPKHATLTPRKVSPLEVTPTPSSSTSTIPSLSQSYTTLLNSIVKSLSQHCCSTLASATSLIKPHLPQHVQFLPSRISPEVASTLHVCAEPQSNLA